MNGLGLGRGREVCKGTNRSVGRPTIVRAGACGSRGALHGMVIGRPRILNKQSTRGTTTPTPHDSSSLPPQPRVLERIQEGRSIVHVLSYIAPITITVTSEWSVVLTTN
jgi:hypothetical protein